MKKCVNCGKKYADERTICPYCGHIEQQESQQDAQSEAKSEEAKPVQTEAKNEETKPVHSEKYNNFVFFMAFPRMIVIFFLLSALCSVAIWFFCRQRLLYAQNPELISSCNIMIILFSVFLVLCFSMLVLSLILNIQKQRNKKSKE